MNRFRIWLTFKLLQAAWEILPRDHEAYKGIFDAAQAIDDGWGAAKRARNG